MHPVDEPMLPVDPIHVEKVYSMFIVKPILKQSMHPAAVTQNALAIMAHMNPQCVPQHNYLAICVACLHVQIFSHHGMFLKQAGSNA